MTSLKLVGKGVHLSQLSGGKRTRGHCPRRGGLRTYRRSEGRERESSLTTDWSDHRGRGKKSPHAASYAHVNSTEKGNRPGCRVFEPTRKKRGGEGVDQIGLGGGRGEKSQSPPASKHRRGRKKEMDWFLDFLRPRRRKGKTHYLLPVGRLGGGGATGSEAAVGWRSNKRKQEIPFLLPQRRKEGKRRGVEKQKRGNALLNVFRDREKKASITHASSLGEKKKKGEGHQFQQSSLNGAPGRGGRTDKCLFTVPSADKEEKKKDRLHYFLYVEEEKEEGGPCAICHTRGKENKFTGPTAGHPPSLTVRGKKKRKYVISRPLGKEKREEKEEESSRTSPIDRTQCLKK